MLEVVQLYEQDLSYEEIGMKLGQRLSAFQVRELLIDSGIKNPVNLRRHGGETEDDYLVRVWGRIGIKEIARKVGWSTRVVKERAYKLGLILEDPSLCEDKARKYPELWYFPEPYLSSAGARIEPGFYYIKLIKNGSYCKITCTRTGKLFLLNAEIVWNIVNNIPSKIPASARA